MPDQTFLSERVEIISERIRLFGKAPVGQTDQFTTLEGGFVGQDSGQGDVGGLDGIGIALPSPPEQLNELMDQMGMRTTVPCTLRETEVFLAILVGIHPTGRKGRDFIGK